MLKAKATPENVMYREAARFYWTATNFLRWLRRSATQERIERDRRIWALITPGIKTIGGSCKFDLETPLRVWRESILRAEKIRSTVAA